MGVDVDPAGPVVPVDVDVDPVDPAGVGVDPVAATVATRAPTCTKT